MTALDVIDYDGRALIRKPGFYRMSANLYHADPCATPSLSSSIAKALLRKTPRHAYEKHPRYTPASVNTPTPAMMFGTVVHKLVLGAGAKVVVIEADDFRSAKAREKRDEALAAGKAPILVDDFDRADVVAERVREGLARIPAAANMFTGEPELVAIWQDGDVWCRAMLDGLDVTHTHVWLDDLKTSGDDFGPDAVGKKIASLGYEVSAAFYRRGVKALLRDAPIFFRFAFVETDTPYEVLVSELDGAGIEHGRRQVCAAIEVWRRCQQTGVWPGYPREIVRAELPAWATASWEAREQNDPLLEGVAYA